MCAANRIDVVNVRGKSTKKTKTFQSMSTAMISTEVKHQDGLCMYVCMYVCMYCIWQNPFRLQFIAKSIKKTGISGYTEDSTGKY